MSFKHLGHILVLELVLHSRYFTKVLVLTAAGGPMKRLTVSDFAALDYVPSEVKFESGGLVLTGFLFTPTGPGPFPCVINNHGSNLHPDSSMISRPGLAALHLDWGYSFFFPHRRGYGHSPGLSVAESIPAPLGSDAYDEQIVHRLDDELHDVMAAISAMRARPQIDSVKIAVSGSSRGGILSILAAAEDTDLRAAINFCGGARQWANHFRLREKMLKAASFLSQPIFLAQAANDFNPAATLELAEELARLGKDHDCQIYPPWGTSAAEGHLFELNGSAIWGPDVQRFLDVVMK